MAAKAVVHHNLAKTHMTDITALVCTLPAQYKKHPNRSPKDVARILKLKQHRSKVSAEKIFAYLNENKNLLELWSHWSEDKRWSPSWYFTKRGTIWVVGKLPDGTEFHFDDPVQACARYVEIELDEIVSGL